MKKKDIRIRLYSPPSHEREVMEIERTLSRPWCLEDVRAAYDDHDGGQVVALDSDGTVAGHFYYEARPKDFVIHRLAVHPDMRGHGIGSAFLKSIQDRCRFGGRRSQILIPVADDDLQTQLWLARRKYFVNTAPQSDGYYGDALTYWFEWEPSPCLQKSSTKQSAER